MLECFFKDRRDGNNDWRWQTYLCSSWTGADPEPTDWPGNLYDGPGYNPFHHVPPGHGPVLWWAEQEAELSDDPFSDDDE